MNKKYINKYYLQEVHDKVIINGCPWCVQDIFDSKEVFNVFYAKIQDNKNVFKDEMTELQKILKAVDLGGAGIAKTATYYPMENVQYMIKKYCKDKGNYFDPSCGWGDRMIGAMKSNVNYFGTDPNFELVDRLNEINTDIRKLIPLNTTTKLFPHGSEEIVIELVNNVDFAFTSPPYFDLEDYKVGYQSYNENTNYQAWLDKYLRPTLKNVYVCLKDDGYFAFNIKNSKKHLLLDDAIEIAESIGWKHIGFETLKNITRITPNGLIDNDEQIPIFSKGAEMPEEEYVEEISLF